MANLEDLIDVYEAAIAEKEAADAALKAASAALQRAKEALADEMVERECTRFGRHGYTYGATPKTRYSKRAGADEELFALLRAEGLGDVIRETVNANTLSSTVGGIAAENGGELPEEWAALVSQYDYVDITRRKG